MPKKRSLPIGELVARYKQGESQTALASAFRVRKSQIRTELIAAGVNLRTKSGYLSVGWNSHRIPVLDRYESHIDRSDPLGCHSWTASCDTSGYGIFSVDGRNVPAHRWGYQNLVGPIPDETPYVLHRCDNPPCQRQEHWFLGTHDDNMADKMSKGRHVAMRGESAGTAKLTENRVAEIRQLYASGGWTQSMLGEAFGVCRSNISWIVRGITWSSGSGREQSLRTDD